MKIAITSEGNILDSNVDPRFGRCNTFLIIDTKTLEFESIGNESAMAAGGAGIQAAQTVAKQDVEAVVTGNIGPNAFETLSAATIKVFIGANGTIKETIDKFEKGELAEAKSSNVSSHSGMNRG